MDVCVCVYADFEVLQASLPQLTRSFWTHLPLDVTNQEHRTNIYADLEDVLKKAWPSMIPITWDELGCSADVIMVH